MPRSTVVDEFYKNNGQCWGCHTVSRDGSTIAMGNAGGLGFWWATDGSASGRFGNPPDVNGGTNTIEAPDALSGDGRYVSFTSEQWPYADVYIERIR